jgi:Zn-dependent peptidase ImmA (M78 family)
MQAFNKYGSKERLFEMFQRVNRIKLNEELLPENKKNAIIGEFVKYASNKLGLNGDSPNIIVSYDESEAKNMKSFGKCTPGDNEIVVVAANRNLADVLRTLAHEIVHIKQFKEGKLDLNSGDTGSEFENEANSIAGVLMREFGKMNPIIFE